MSTIPSKFYILHNVSDKFLVIASLEILPIVWNHFGSYCIIPCEVLENAVDNLEMYDKLSSKTTRPQVAIYWNQGIPISNQAGRALVGE